MSENQHIPVRSESYNTLLRKQNSARIVLSIILTLLGIFTLREFIPALLWGCIFAIACWPLYVRVKKKWPFYNHYNILFPLLFTVLIAMIFMVPLFLIIIKAASESQGILEWLHEIQQTGIPLPLWAHKLPFGQATFISWWHRHLMEPEDISYLLQNIQTGHMALTKQIGAQILHRSTLFLFSILTLFFLFRDGNTIIRQSLVASRRLFGKQGEKIAQQMIASVHGTVSGLVFVGLGEGVILGALYAVMGTPHPALFGIITAVSAMIPFCSVVIIFLVAMLTLFHSTPLAAIIILAAGLSVIFIADHFVRPGLIGGSTKLPFLWVLLGILGGIETWGLLGLFLGPAIMSALDLLWKTWVREKRTSPTAAEYN